MKKEKNLVVIQLSGGNDYLNTIVPYESGLYYDYRPNMGLKNESILPIDNKIAFNSNMDVLKKQFDNDNLAVMMGIGYPEPNRSHFRSMDIWHTAEPFESSSVGWLGKTVKNIVNEINKILLIKDMGLNALSEHYLFLLLLLYLSLHLHFLYLFSTVA